MWNIGEIRGQMDRGYKKPNINTDIETHSFLIKIEPEITSFGNYIMTNFLCTKCNKQWQNSCNKRLRLFFKKSFQ